MNDENEFVQKVRFEVEDTELSASLDRFQAALGRAGETANREIDESLTKAASSANEVAKETANIGKEASSAAKETQKISSASREAKKQTDALDGAFSKLKGTISAAVAAYAGFQGLSKLVGFGKQTVELFKVQDRAERALKFQMQRNGTDARFGELQRFAANLQKNSMYGDEAILNAASVWSNKIKDVDNNKRMMQLVADYTARTTNGAEVGADQLKSYTMTLMSALSGRGTMTLEQQGFDTTAIKELQKIRQKGGTVTETMQVEALEKTLASVKGFAREMANTDAGKIAQLQNEIGDVKEEIGRELLPVFAELAREIKANIPSIKKLFEGFASVLKSLVRTLSENIGTISAFTDGLASLLQLFSVAPIKTMAFVGALKYAVPMLDAATKGSMAFGGALGGLGKNWQNLLKAGLFTATIWGLQQIFKLGNAIKQAWKEHERQNAIEGASEVKKQVESGTYFADLLRTYRRDFQALGTQPVEMDGLQRMAVNEKGDFIDSEGKPNSVLGDSTTVTLYGNNPYAKRMTVKDYEAIDFGKMMEIYKRCFSDASQFTMHFVGNVEMDELRPLLEKYIASLPATHQEVKLTPKSEVLPGSRTCMFEKEQETPTCNINIQYAQWAAEMNGQSREIITKEEYEKRFGRSLY